MGPGAKTMSFRDKLRLEQERKFGVAPLARDAVTGEELNPNIPEVMTSAPWFVGVDGPTMAHHQLGREVTDEETTKYSAKRSRWEGDVTCSDAWVRHEAKDEAAPKRAREDADDADFSRRRAAELRSAFEQRKGNVVGTEVKALPKYLENVEAGVLYDPVSRTMLGNPHVEGSSVSSFRGDNSRYASESTLHELEFRRYILSGKAGNDFAGIGFENAKLCPGDGVCLSQPCDEREKVVVAKLYGGEEAPSENKATAPIDEFSSANALPPERPEDKMGTVNGHRYVYGSFFDRERLLWGYKCCRRLGRHAPSCQL